MAFRTYLVISIRLQVYADVIRMVQLVANANHPPRSQIVLLDESALRH
jgi:hypothetical protein